jgi:hypothetical protein
MLMTEHADPFRDLDQSQAIDLRWSLRDVCAKRWKMSPIKGARIGKLLSMGLIEFKDELPVLTNAGL